MRREPLRQNRYYLLALDELMFEEAEAGLGARNELPWVKGELEHPSTQFVFNELWFDVEFRTFLF